MNSMDLLSLSHAHSNALHQQNQYQEHHHQQQQQMNIVDFQDKLFDRSEGQGTENLQLCETTQLDHSVEVRSHEDNSSEQQIDANFMNYSSGQAKEIENSSSHNGQLDRGVSESDGEAHGKGHEDSGETNDCDDDDEEAFVALCTDASSVLNKHDPSRRYYINKLYQPMNGNQDETPLEEQDDEYLLYQELRFLESTAQESTDDRQRVQLTKILEDDEGDEDVVDNLVSDNQREDPLDRLHLTTIIEAFESFPSSPLIGTCQDSDPLIGGVCAVNDHHHCQDKPDSTRHGDSPIRCSNSTTSYPSIQDHEEPYDRDQDLRHDQDPNLSSISSANSIIHHDHMHHQQQYHHQINQDTPSENSSFQKVSSSFVHPLESNKSSTSSNQLFCPSNEVQQQNLKDKQIDVTSNKTVPEHPTKRSLQLAVEDNGTRIPSSKQTENYIKRKRSTSDEDETNSKFYVQNKDTSADGVTSSMMNQIPSARFSILGSDNNINSSNSNKTNSYRQQEFVTSEDGDEGTMSMEDDSASDGNRGHQHIRKYRRRTANARERIRMREINQAFEKLKKVVPIELIQQSASGDESDQTSVSSRRGGKSASNNGGQHSDSQSVKLTKITTLRLAVSYIAKLSEVLNQHPESGSSNGGQLQTTSANVTDSLNGDRFISTPMIGGIKTSSSSSTTKTRRRRSRKSTSELKACLVKAKTDDITKESGESLRNNSLDNSEFIIKNDSPDLRIEPRTLVLNQTNQHRQILISNNVLHGNGLQHQANTFLPLQRQQTQQRDFLNRQDQHPQQQFAYAQCNRQPLTISQASTANGQDRAFVTPVTVAILGIPTSTNNRGVNEHQGLQLIGIQNPQQLQQRTTQHIQTNSPYGLITQQPQQVAFTLDDINGVSVLRLANTQSHNINTQQQTIQFQHNGSIIQRQQQSQVLATTAHASGYQNYTTTYQPVHISQFQPANVATIRPLAQQQQQHQTATVQLRTNSINGRTQETHLLQISNDLRATISNQRNLAISDNHIAATPATTNPSTSTINTGNNSDCGNFSISPTMIAQHLNNNNNNNIDIDSNNFNNINNINNSNVVQARFKIQQANCSNGNIVSPNSMLNIPQGSRIFQTQTVSGCNTISSNQTTQANLIYINPTSFSNSNVTTCRQQHQPETVQHLGQTSISNGCKIIANTNPLVKTTPASFDSINNSASNLQSYEQVKFVTQPESQIVTNEDPNKNVRVNETNIHQLVASLATSIQPKVASTINSNRPNQNEPASEQQKQQPKRTYRFHNYDGNTITNHLYNNHDKSGQQQHYLQDQQQQLSKRSSPRQQAQQLLQSDQSPAITTKTNHSNNGQRSRQNSLSSTCSTNSCSSSSLTSLSTESPSVPMLSMVVVKSPPPPPLEKGNTTTTSNSAQSMIEGTNEANEVVGCN